MFSTLASFLLCFSLFLFDSILFIHSPCHFPILFKQANDITLYNSCRDFDRKYLYMAIKYGTGSELIMCCSQVKISLLFDTYIAKEFLLICDSHLTFKCSIHSKVIVCISVVVNPFEPLFTNVIWIFVFVLHYENVCIDFVSLTCST